MPTICTQGLPALRRLELEYWPVARFAAIRGLVNPSLRSLIIRHPSTRFTLHEWSTILTELPLLDKLALTCVFPEDELKQPRPKPLSLIQLPHLESLELSADSWINLLSLLHIIVPSANIHLDFRPWESGPLATRLIPYEAYIDILDAINQKFTPREPRNEAVSPNYLSLRITNNTTGCFSMRVTLGDSDHGYCPRSHVKNNLHTPHLLRFQLNDIDPVEQGTPYKPLCDMLCKTFSLEKIRVMRLGPANSTGLLQNTLLDLRNLFTQLTNIRVLSIRFANKDYLGDYLSTLLGVSNVENEAEKGAANAIRESQILFPALEVLTVEHPIISAPVADVEPLRRTLLARKAAGYPISKVHICLSTLRRLGKPLVWPDLEPKLLPLTSLGCTIDHCYIDFRF
ncbi:hypothetical protein EIP86_009922 [Pleurotus ostreatoroseus]|nr:hypothetical protein EIP86_009922 [Pleurotus ostreatoroseus]